MAVVPRVRWTGVPAAWRVHRAADTTRRGPASTRGSPASPPLTAWAARSRLATAGGAYGTVNVNGRRMAWDPAPVTTSCALYVPGAARAETT